MLGTLRDRVVIQQPTETRNTQGGVTQTWGTLATVWANVKAVPRGDEQIAQGRIAAIGDYDVTIRYRADVTPKMRLSWTPYQATAAKTLEIHAAQPANGERVLLSLACGELAS